MSEVSCASGGGHWWGTWGLISDPINIDAGDTDGYVYVRECNVFGCNALQKVKALAPVDEPVTYESQFKHYRK